MEHGCASHHECWWGTPTGCTRDWSKEITLEFILELQAKSEEIKDFRFKIGLHGQADKSLVMLCYGNEYKGQKKCRKKMFFVLGTDHRMFPISESTFSLLEELRPKSSLPNKVKWVSGSLPDSTCGLLPRQSFLEGSIHKNLLSNCSGKNIDLATWHLEPRGSSLRCTTLISKDDHWSLPSCL